MVVLALVLSPALSYPQGEFPPDTSKQQFPEAFTERRTSYRTRYCQLLIGSDEDYKNDIAQPKSTGGTTQQNDEHGGESAAVVQGVD